MAVNRFGVSGTDRIVELAGIGIASASGAVCEDREEESGKIKVVNARCWSVWFIRNRVR